MSGFAPTISAIIPVFNSGDTLQACLEALAKSGCPAAQCLVVNDGSTDGSAALAHRMGATVLTTDGRRGPAHARNLGARHATGDVLLFVDSDVALHPDAVGRIRERFASDAALDAVMGAYDDAPAMPGFVSQFKNLMHTFVHRQGKPQASSFWCGCGAVKRSVYLEHGGLDESYLHPSIEDIEFGFRLVQAGRRIALDPRIQAKHLKAWTLSSLVYTDIVRRGIPWTELILRTGFLPNDLNLRWSQRFSAIATGLLVVSGELEVFQGLSGRILLPPSFALAGVVLSLAVVFLLNLAFYRYLASRKGWLFSFSAVPMHVLYYLYSAVAFAIGTTKHVLHAAPSENTHAVVSKPHHHGRSVWAAKQVTLGAQSAE